MSPVAIGYVSIAWFEHFGTSEVRCVLATRDGDVWKNIVGKLARQKVQYEQHNLKAYIGYDA